MAHGSPFSPKPGQLPACPRGRARELDIVRNFAQQVAHSPVSSSNGLLLTGTAGIGKSTLLSSVAVMMQERGWRVAMISKADPRDPGRALGQTMDSAGMRGMASRVRDKLQRLRGSVKGGSISIGLEGPSATVELGRPQGAEDIAARIADAGVHARETSQPAVVLIDDLHDWSADDLRGLCEGLDACSEAGHPVGVIATSLPRGAIELTKVDRTRAFDAATIEPLTPQESAAVLIDTAAVRDGVIEPAAGEQLLKFSQGHPDRLQLAAHEAWTALPSNKQTITVDAATAGIGRATEKLDRQVHAVNWQALSAPEQSMTQSIAAVGRGPVDAAAVRAHMTARHRDDFEAVRTSLVAKDIVHETPGGGLAFNNPGTAPWIMANRPPSGSVAHILQAGAPAQQLGTAPKQLGTTAPQVGSTAGRGASAGQGVTAAGQGQRPAHLDRGKTQTGPTYER
ncbi:ATP-binding protein [Kribbella deserti]|uniref:ATP-binding protein n=1 Tax=Kribbella deserti TaxID=1926257 RepID=A0ABV6QFV7_9ACTN